VAAQPLRRAAFALFRNGFEHPRELTWVVSRARHDLRAEQVRLLLVVAAVLHQPRAQAEL
jgi:hypothetical protein